MPFDVWNERIIGAETEHDRRRLLAEIGSWQVGRLTDIPAQREASSARSRLYAGLGDHDAAVREARSLLSLCQTPPLATPEELEAARRYLASLGEKGIVGGHALEAARRQSSSDASPRGREPRAARKERPESNALDGALAALSRGAWDEAVSAVAHQGGPRALLVRAAAVLSRAAASGDYSGVPALAEALRGALVRPGPRDAAKPREAGTPGHPLEALVGQPVPKAWKARLKIVEQWLAAHPKRADELAALALQHHVDVSGPQEPAPWLITTTTVALARDGKRTRDTLARLTEAGAWAVTAYSEWPFEPIVALVKAARTNPVAVRRGVLSRGEPKDRKLWTVRLGAGDAERMVAVASPTDEAFEEGLPERLADRIRELCPRSVLVAPGAGNEALRAAASARGIGVVESTAPSDILAAFPAAPAPAAPAAEPTVDALAAVQAALAADTLDEAALADAIGGLRRAQAALGVARSVLATVDPAVRAERTAAVIRVLDRVVPPGVALQEAVTVAVQLAAEGAGAAVDVLAAAPERLGGPGLDDLVAVVRALHDGGWAVSRVFRGPTARERRDGPALAALGAHTVGLWRLRADRGGRSVEVWVVRDPSPEAMAAAPQLLLVDRARVIVLGSDDLVGWYGTLGGPPGLVWGTAGATGLLAAVGDVAAASASDDDAT